MEPDLRLMVVFILHFCRLLSDNDDHQLSVTPLDQNYKSLDEEHPVPPKVKKSAKDVHPVLEPEKVYSFEEALTLTGTGKFHYFLLLVSGLCLMTEIIEIMVIGIVMPFMKCDLKATIAEQGFLASSGGLGIVLSSHFMGFLADTCGRVKVLRTAFVFVFITSVISAFSINIWMLIVLRFCNGFFISGSSACVLSFLGEFHGSKTRLRYVTLFTMFASFGVLVLPGMAIGILPMQLNATVLGLKFTPWRVLILVNSTVSLIVLFGLLVMPESPKYAFIQGKRDQALSTLRKVFRLNTGKPAAEYPVKQLYNEISGDSLISVHRIKDGFKLIWNQTVLLFCKDRLLHTTNICCITFIIFGLSQGLSMWFPTMLEQLVAQSGQGYLFCENIGMAGSVSTNATANADNCGKPIDTEMFKFLIINGAVLTVTYVIQAFIVNIVGKRNLLMGWFLIAAGSSLAIHWVSSLVLSVAALILFISAGNAVGIVYSISVEYFPTNVSAMAMCLVMMCGRLGAAVGSLFVGLLLFSDCDALFYICMSGIGIVVLLSLFLLKT